MRVINTEYQDCLLGVQGTVRIEEYGTVCPAQDGVIFGEEIFNFNHRGHCRVYSLTDCSQTAEFTLDKADILPPHSNAVCFGIEYAAEGDEFPLLYVNIYNNFADKSDRMEGTCLVYRLFRVESGYDTKLLQILRIGFTEDLDLWKSLPDNGDVRPYGNFVIDTDHQMLYAFVMRNRESVTRFFQFRLPKVNEGILSDVYGVPIRILTKDEIIRQFDTEWSCYVQGACYYNGKIYSSEGGASREIPPGLRIIDLKTASQQIYMNLLDLGMTDEPELVDVCKGKLFFRDGSGKIYTFTFDKDDSIM